MSSSRHCYTSLKKIEIVGYSFFDCSAMKSLATLLHKLEVLVFENFSTSYHDEGSFLTRVLLKASLKSSLKCLKVGFCFVKHH